MNRFGFDDPQELPINTSAILVVVQPAQVRAMRTTLDALPGIDVHHVDAATGRLIVTQEAATIDEEVVGLTRIQSLSGVILAEMVLHHFADETEGDQPPSPPVPDKLKN